MEPKKVAFSVVGSVFLLHVAVLGFVGDEHLRILASNLIQVGSSWLACGFCFWTAKRSREHMRLFWILVGTCFLMWGLGQSGWTYFEALYGPRKPQDAPTDLFFFFSFAPMLLALLLRKESLTAGRDWARALDAVQVGILAVSAYLFFFLVPARNASPQRFVDELLGYVFTSRNIFIAALFLLRSLLAVTQNGRRLYGRLAIFWIVYGCVTAYTNNARLHAGAITGQWYDLGWSTPFLFAAVLAATWKELPGTAAFDERPQGLKALASAYFLPTIVPLAIVLMAGRVTTQYFYMAYGAILASFVCYSARLAVTQYRLTISAKEVDLAEARFQLLFSQNPQPIWVFDLESLNILEVNRAAERDYGYSREEFLKLRVSDLLLPEELPELMKMVRNRVAGDFFRARHRRKDGTTITAQVSAQAMTFAGRPAEIEIAQDIGEKLALEEQLRQSQKMEAVGTLAGGVAHDFNNLLTVITGYSKLLEERFSSDEQTHGQLQQINAAADRAAALTRQLLAFSRRQVLQPTKLELNVVVQKIVAKNLAAMMGPQIELRTNLLPGPLFVKADHGQIEQVITNLAENARDAMPRGGVVTIETATVFLSAEEAQSLDVNPRSYATLTITDEGSGMSKETMAHIFEPFFSTKADKASGLGLSSVYGIVRQSEGAVEVKSQEGQGSMFRVYLPVAETHEIERRKQPRAALPGGNETILLVEDDTDLRDLSRRVLTMSGYHVLPAAHGRDALRVSAEHAEEIELMVTDVIMPGMSGRELAERLQTARPKMKVLFVSGYTDNIIAERGMLAPGTAFLQKPFSPSHLAGKVREVLDEARHKGAEA